MNLNLSQAIDRLQRAADAAVLRTDELEAEVEDLTRQLKTAGRVHETTFRALFEFRQAMEDDRLVYVEDIALDRTYAGHPRRFAVDDRGRIRAVQITTLGGWEVNIEPDALRVLQAVPREYRAELEALVDEDVRRR